MKIKISRSFSNKLANQVKYISKDKPQAARKFKNDILRRIQKISEMPYGNRQSIYFEDKNIRDLIFKGYTIVYRVKIRESIIEVFGFIKHEEKL